jgi:hypothetical protein
VEAEDEEERQRAHGQPIHAPHLQEEIRAHRENKKEDLLLLLAVASLAHRGISLAQPSANGPRYSDFDPFNRWVVDLLRVHGSLTHDSLQSLITSEGRRLVRPTRDVGGVGLKAVYLRLLHRGFFSRSTERRIHLEAAVAVSPPPVLDWLYFRTYRSGVGAQPWMLLDEVYALPNAVASVMTRHCTALFEGAAETSLSLGIDERTIQRLLTEASAIGACLNDAAHSVAQRYPMLNMQ